MKNLNLVSIFAANLVLCTVDVTTVHAASELFARSVQISHPSIKLVEKTKVPEEEHTHPNSDKDKDVDGGHKDATNPDSDKDHDAHKDGATGGKHGDKETGHAGEGDGHKDKSASEIRLTPDQIKLAGIEVITVSLGQIVLPVDLAGEVTINQDRVVEVVPKVPGVVGSVHSYLGDRIEKGAVMSVIDSREFADAKSIFVAARERAKLATIKYEREDRLWKKQISSEQEYLDAEIAKFEAKIAERTAAQKLLALGVSSDDLKKIADRPDQSLTRYEIVAPMSGTVIEKHITSGASVDEKEMIYRVADLQALWVIASVYEKDMARIQRGQPATITTKAYPDRKFEGQITWISSTIDEKTRTLKVRIEVDNSQGLLKPGMFVRASVVVDVKDNVLTVPISSVRRQGGETIVFIEEGAGRFERRDVKLGAQSDQSVEILGGLKPGQRVVSAGSFLLKSELEKEGFEAGHGH